jgi:hypothetical protein
MEDIWHKVDLDVVVGRYTQNGLYVLVFNLDFDSYMLYGWHDSE